MSPELELAGVGGDGRERQAAAALLEHREQLRLEIDADHLVAASGQMQGDATGSAAEIDHGASGRARQLLPERQIGRVGAALDVVPDRDAHCQNSFARPRSASSLRSSISAV